MTQEQTPAEAGAALFRYWAIAPVEDYVAQSRNMREFVAKVLVEKPEEEALKYILSEVLYPAVRALALENRPNGAASLLEEFSSIELPSTKQSLGQHPSVASVIGALKQSLVSYFD